MLKEEPTKDKAQGLVSWRIAKKVVFWISILLFSIKRGVDIFIDLEKIL